MDKNLASWGGAMEFKESIFKCTDSSITRNHATFDGGALNCQACICLREWKCVFLCMKGLMPPLRPPQCVF